MWRQVIANTRRAGERKRGNSLRRGVALLDVLVAGVLLGATLTVIIGIANRSLRAQIEGEQLQRVSALLDELLAHVLANGPDDYARRFPTDGQCEPPYEDFEFSIDVQDQGAGLPYVVTATVWWDSGRRSESVETWIAPRLGDEPDPERAPETPVERQ